MTGNLLLINVNMHHVNAKIATQSAWATRIICILSTV